MHKTSSLKHIYEKKAIYKHFNAHSRPIPRGSHFELTSDFCIHVLHALKQKHTHNQNKQIYIEFPS